MGGLPIFGSAPLVPWFISVATPKALGRRFKCVRALRVQEDELELQTHTIPRLSLCTSPSYCAPAPTLLCETTPALPYSINLYTFQHSYSFPPVISPTFPRYRSCMQEWLVVTLGMEAGGNYCDGCLVCHASQPWHRCVRRSCWDLWSLVELCKVSIPPAGHVRVL